MTYVNKSSVNAYREPGEVPDYPEEEPVEKKEPFEWTTGRMAAVCIALAVVLAHVGVFMCWSAFDREHFGAMLLCDALTFGIGSGIYFSLRGA